MIIKNKSETNSKVQKVRNYQKRKQKSKISIYKLIRDN